MPVKSNTSISQSLGNLTSWKKEPSGLSGKTDQENFRIVFYNDSIARISITRHELFDDFSYSVIAAAPLSDYPVTESEHELVIETGTLILKVQKNPVRFSFLNLNHQIINEDDSAFGTSWSGDQVTTYKKLQEGERFIGLGEKTGPLDRRGAGYINWNTDNFAYIKDADPLYSSTPFYIGIHHNLAYGIFFDNTYKSFFNFGASNNRFSSFAADAGDMNYYFIYGETAGEIIQHYTHLTGRTPVPPLWSIGYQQCRYSYYPDKEVLSVARTFREKEIPADVIVFDIHYMDKYKIFTWNQRDFPNPKALLEELKQMGFHLVVMCDPGIKVEEGYKTYDDGVKENVFITYPDGTKYTGQVWPGWCHFPDFTNPKTRQWWKEQFQDYVNIGVDGFWNDMNEIATWGNMLPENIEMDFEGNKSSIRRGRNIYGFQMARSTYEGTKALLKGKRPFNLTRSAFSGIQRYAAVWTGDNVAYDEHMMLGVRMVNSMGLTGMAFAGYDVGGFVGDANKQLFARWVSLGALSPFFRGHSMINSRDSEPWSYGEEIEQISRNYIRFRYQLMPYIYSLFYEASQSGIPVQRSLAIDYTHDPKIYDGQFQHQYLFGPSLLVCPVESFKEFVKVYLPFGDWYYLYNGKQYGGNTEVIIECPMHKLPVFVKGGAIIPMQVAKSNTSEKTDVLILHVYAGKDLTSFVQYEDDGTSFNYENGEFLKRTIEHKSAERKLVLNACEGNFNSSFKTLKIVFHGLEYAPQTVNVNGQAIGLRPDVNRFFAGLEKYDPIHDPEPAPEEPVHIAETSYLTQEIIVTW
ncbi:MAG: glycoside hydrolase family 31 protein [Cyclobacteriaceae bacterium]|nr:glycoside hydrolase family 31 protein [Cyclobacteriaceae bacterium]